RSRDETGTHRLAIVQPRSIRCSCAWGDDKPQGPWSLEAPTYDTSTPAVESALRLVPKDRRHRPASVFGVFFMLLLPRRIGLSQNRWGFAQAKVQLTEQSLTLADSQLNPIGLLNPCRQSLAIPQVYPHSCIARLIPERSADLFHLFRTQSAWPPGSISLGQSGPVLVVGNDEPNTRLNAERRRATRRPPGRSGPAPRARRRAGGDRNATPQNVGFSCCKLKTDVASDIDSGLMATGEHFLIRCAITYDVVFSKHSSLLTAARSAGRLFLRPFTIIALA